MILPVGPKIGAEPKLLFLEGLTERKAAGEERDRIGLD